MVELERTFDPVRLGALQAVLADCGIDCMVFDSGAGGLWRGAIPCRLMVSDDDLDLARRALAAAGIPDG